MKIPYRTGVNVTLYLSPLDYARRVIGRYRFARVNGTRRQALRWALPVWN
jgi:hypothetical protein